jgi:hydroxypyruvate reductase
MSAAPDERWTDARARSVLRRVFDAAVASADPGPAVTAHLPQKPRGRCVVVGAGKASAAMAAAVDAAWPDVSLSGLVVTRYGCAMPAGRIGIVEAAHPVPDAASERAARAILAEVAGLGPDDLVLALISGGGSALMALPAAPMTLDDKKALNRALLASGAPIAEMNIVRKHVSAIKGGRLALAAQPARVVTLAISDIPGDDPAAIASGPTLPDPSTLEEARDIVRRYAMALTPAAQAALQAAAETPKPGEIAPDVRIVAAPSMALRAASEVARREGLHPLILGDAIEGEAREFGVALAGMARSVRAHGLPLGAPALLLSGGETTVTIAGPAGRGGRNTELMLGFALALKGEAGVWGLACDSDGIDGTDDAAGAIVAPDTLARARAAGLDARAFLAAHDSYSFFDSLDDLVRTGPTRTNVNDIRAILIS